MKTKARIATFLINIFSIIIGLLYPGPSTILSVIVMLGLNLTFLMMGVSRENKNEQFETVIGYIAIILDCIVIVILAILAHGSYITFCGSDPRTYYVALKDDMAFWGGGKFKYGWFAIPIAIYLFIYELATLIKTMSSKKRLTWAELAQNSVR